MKLRRTCFLSLCFAAMGALAAQDGGTPDDYETEADRRPSFQTDGNLLIRGATILTVTQGTIENGSILVTNGKITAIGKDLDAPGHCKVLDGTGMFVMPGIIDAHSHIAGGGNEGTQSVVPEVRIADQLNHTDQSIYRALAGGTTAAHIMHGSANAIGGQGAVIKLKYGRPVRDLHVTSGPGLVKFALGENPKRSGSPTGDRPARYPATRMGVEAVLRRSFNAALEYRDEWKRHAQATARGRKTVPPRTDLRLQALVDIMEGRILVHSHCYRADEILMLMRVAEDYGFRIGTFQHVLEGYKVAPELAAHGAGGSTFSDWWAYKIEAYDAIPYNAQLMHLAGITTTVNSDSGDLIRRLYHEAAKSLRYGNMPEADTLALITINAAIQLGLDDRMGSLEVGKDGDLAVFNGHPLSVYSRCEYTFVDGECFFERDRDELFNATGPSFGPVDCPDPSRLRVPGAGGYYAITGGTVYPVSGPPIEGGTVVIHDGIISSVSRGPAPSGAEVVDATGLSVYPGLFDASTTLGLGEIGSVAESGDAREIGGSQPDLRAAASINADSAHIPVARCAGTTTSVVMPDGGPIAGRAALVQLDGWTWEQMTLDDSIGLVVAFPRVSEDAAPEKGLEEQAVKDLGELFEEARRYEAARSSDRHVARDLGMESLLPYAKGEAKVLLRVNSKNQIRVAVLFAEQQELDYVLVGVNDGWLVAGFLKEHGATCIVGKVLTTPRGRGIRYDAPFQNPARLHAAGVPFALASFDQSNARQLHHHAGMAAAFGLPREEALAAITLRPAEILGVADKLGSLEAGKIANVIVTDGDPLEFRTHVRYEFIGGRPVPLESKHTRLFERYKARILEDKRGSAPSTSGG